MQITGSRPRYLLTTILSVLGVLVWLFTHSDVIAYQEATYPGSAHGDHTSGVNRSSATCENWPGEECVTGSCAHCHDTFDPNFCGNDPNGLMLFAPKNPTSQTNNFCFQCHDRDSSVQAVTNYSYSKTFGGGSSTTPDDIKDAFNFGRPNQASTTGSSHNLNKMRSWLINNGAWLTTDTIACLACHDHHLAQQNTGADPHPFGGVKTAIRRTTDGASGTAANQWGDEPLATSGNKEMMSDYTNKYQAPYYGDISAEGWEPSYEPAGDDTSDGSNLPNFNGFCLVCHAYSIGNSKTDADPVWIGGRNLRAIRWGTNGDAHGGRADSPNDDPTCTPPVYGSLKPPYNEPDKNYILACTDCHEPHGSRNVFLLRTHVNGKDLSAFLPISELTPMESEGFYEFCTACHEVNFACGPHWQNPYRWGCAYCHSHGLGPGGQGF